MKKLLFALTLCLVTFFSPKNTFAKVEDPKVVVIKVVDNQGKLVLTKAVSINEFLENGHNIVGLPQNSLFVLYHGNTAYYITTENTSK
jgi:hypothetical protein